MRPFASNELNTIRLSMGFMPGKLYHIYSPLLASEFLPLQREEVLLVPRLTKDPFCAYASACILVRKAGVVRLTGNVYTDPAWVTTPDEDVLRGIDGIRFEATLTAFSSGITQTPARLAQPRNCHGFVEVRSDYTCNWPALTTLTWLQPAPPTPTLGFGADDIVSYDLGELT